MKKNILLIIAAAITLSSLGQTLDINADFRSRFEHRNGYSTLIPDTMKAANFITQRSRLIFDYIDKKIKLRFSPQNVHVWGDVLSTSKSDLFNSFHEAFGEFQANKKLSIKLGRQEIAYDDHRIMGNVDWAMQARSHDAVLLKYKIDSLQIIHIGATYNANSESLFKENYFQSQYKTFQYLWYHTDLKNFQGSLLFLNNGMPYLINKIENLAFSQTFGPKIIYLISKFKIEASAYMQTGKLGTAKVNSLYHSAVCSYHIKNKLNIGFGYEFISGKASNDNSNIIKSFNPLYGTNHKFNGFMDYFYVGNHLNSIGLKDFLINIAYDYKKTLIKFTPHSFASAADLYKNAVIQKKNLGTELDFTLLYKMMDNVKIEIGYSAYLKNVSTEVLKNVYTSQFNQWFYCSAFISPKILSYKTEKK